MKTSTRTLSVIASDIRNDWGSRVNYAARPYLNAMLSIDSVNDNYGLDSGRSIVLYFLSNAASYRGEKAKALKTELKKVAGIK